MAVACSSAWVTWHSPSARATWHGPTAPDRWTAPSQREEHGCLCRPESEKRTVLLRAARSVPCAGYAAHSYQDGVSFWRCIHYYLRCVCPSDA
eukprot:365155-Chlamydomonas_euryale.AAC.5